jgi:hypothetical protein
MRTPCREPHQHYLYQQIIYSCTSNSSFGSVELKTKIKQIYTSLFLLISIYFMFYTICMFSNVGEVLYKESSFHLDLTKSMVYGQLLFLVGWSFKGRLSGKLQVQMICYLVNNVYGPLKNSMIYTSLFLLISIYFMFYTIFMFWFFLYVQLLYISLSIMFHP